MNKCPETVYKKIKAINKQDKRIRFNCTGEHGLERAGRQTGGLRGGRLSTGGPVLHPLQQHPSQLCSSMTCGHQGKQNPSRMSLLRCRSDQMLAHNPGICSMLIFYMENSFCSLEFTLHFCFPKLVPAVLCQDLF